MEKGVKKNNSNPIKLTPPFLLKSLFNYKFKI